MTSFGSEKYTYLFRSWRILLQTAINTPNIWIYSYDKKIMDIRRLHERLSGRNIKIDECEYEDDLPKFLTSISSDELERLINGIDANIVSFEDCHCKLYTVHSYKGMEADNIRIANDINIKDDENIYYVALTRAMKQIIVDDPPENQQTFTKHKNNYKPGKIKQVSTKSITNYFDAYMFTDKLDKVEKTEKKEKIKSDKLTFELFIGGKTIEEIAVIRGNGLGTTIDHIILNMPHEYVTYEKFMTNQEYNEIKQSFTKFGNTFLQIIKSNVSSGISYEKIKIVQKLMF